jgi:hypothetical protein
MEFDLFVSGSMLEGLEGADESKTDRKAIVSIDRKECRMEVLYTG